MFYLARILVIIIAKKSESINSAVDSVQPDSLAESFSRSNLHLILIVYCFIVLNKHGKRKRESQFEINIYIDLNNLNNW